MIKDDKLPALHKNIMDTKTMDELYNIYVKILDSDSYGKDKAHGCKTEQYIEKHYIKYKQCCAKCPQYKKDFDKNAIGKISLFQKLLLRMVAHPNQDYILNKMRIPDARGSDRTKK